MALRWKEFRDKVRPQGMLIEMDFPEKSVSMGIEDVRAEIIKRLKNKSLLKNLLVQLVQVFGVSFSLSELKTVMKGLEKENQIVVTRVPVKRPSGHRITGWEHTGRDGYTVNVERSSQWQQTLL
jgi:hypothetical protein